MTNWDGAYLDIKYRWQSENQLVVETKVRVLEELTALDQYPDKLTKEQIKESLQLLRKFLEILQDNRAATQGSEDWHFTLKLWHRRFDTEANLKRFDVEWEGRRAENSKQVAGNASIRTQPDATAQLNAEAVVEKAKANQELGNVPTTPVDWLSGVQDWGEAPDVSSFYGRTEELSQLEQWIVQERCKVVALLGMGGIGKTTLAMMLADQIQEHFEFLIWRSLKSTPSIQTLLKSRRDTRAMGSYCGELGGNAIKVASC